MTYPKPYSIYLRGTISLVWLWQLKPSVFSVVHLVFFVKILEGSKNFRMAGVCTLPQTNEEHQDRKDSGLIGRCRAF